MTATVDNAVADLERANAELQRQLDERTAECDEALQRETATAEVLRVINSSPGDLAPVFDAILEKAHSLCASTYGSLQLFDGLHFRAVATRGIPEPLAEMLRQPYVPGADGGGPRLMAGDRFYEIPDMAEFVAQSSAALPASRAAVEVAGIRTLLFLPLRKDDLLLGVITAGRKEVRPFAEKEIVLLENFAAQAVIAMENARLITETREALDQQTATAEVLQVINASPGDLAPVFDAMLEKALRLCDGAFGNLLNYDGELFHVMAAVHAEGQIAERQRHRPPFRVSDLLHPIVQGEHLEFVEDVRESGSYQDPYFREMVDGGGYRGLLNIALRKEGVLFGVIGIFRTEARPFSEKQIALLQNFAAQAVIAMENAHLFGELRARTEEVAGWNRELEADRRSLPAVRCLRPRSRGRLQSRAARGYGVPSFRWKPFTPSGPAFNSRSMSGYVTSSPAVRSPITRKMASFCVRFRK